MAHGIYPPLLESEGLESTLRAVGAIICVPSQLRLQGLGRYERSVEQTVYFCVLETLERSRMSGIEGAHVEVADVATATWSP